MPLATAGLLEESDFTIALPGGTHPARWYRGTGAACTALVLHLHAGAFTRGGLPSGTRMARVLAHAGAAVLSLAYPLAPAHRFPEAVEAAHATMVWMAGQRAALGLPGVPLHAAGDEAGATLAAAVSMVCRDRCGPPLAGQVLVSPMLDPRVVTASFRRFMRESTSCRWMDGWREYLRSPLDIDHPYAVPARAMRLQGLPRTLLLTAEDDPMRDEAAHFAHRLDAAGVQVELTVLPAPTGWPLSLSQTRSPPHPDSLVRARLQAFLGGGA